MIHGEALAANDMNEELAYMFSRCIKIVNFVKARPLNHRSFENMCREMEAEHKQLLLDRPTEVRWLSRGRVVQRVCELREELLIFVNQHNELLAHFFIDETRVARLAYVADIFNILNSLNLSLQGPDTQVLKTHDKSRCLPEKNFVYGREDVRKAQMICFRVG